MEFKPTATSVNICSHAALAVQAWSHCRSCAYMCPHACPMHPILLKSQGEYGDEVCTDCQLQLWPASSPIIIRLLFDAHLQVLAKHLKILWPLILLATSRARP